MTLYFGYGSNLWKDQMMKRCPENKLIGVGKLEGWKWIINTRGYANIIPSPDHIVYGLIYELSEKDEKCLDRFEHAYKKNQLTVKLVSTKASNVNTEEIDVMTYIDEERVEVGKVVDEYIGRMNKAIEDGIEEGISEDYFKQNLYPSLLSH